MPTLRNTVNIGQAVASALLRDDYDISQGGPYTMVCEPKHISSVPNATGSVDHFYAVELHGNDNDEKLKLLVMI